MTRGERPDLYWARVAATRPAGHYTPRVIPFKEGAFVPLTAGLFWKRANAAGSLAAVTMGIAAWLGCEQWTPGAAVPPVLAGLAASAAGMFLASLAPSRRVPAAG